MKKITALMFCLLLGSCAAYTPLVLPDASMAMCSLPYFEPEKSFYSGGVCKFYMEVGEEDKGTYELVIPSRLRGGAYLRVVLSNPRSIEDIVDPNSNYGFAGIFPTKVSEEHRIPIQSGNINQPHLWTLILNEPEDKISQLKAYFSSAYIRRFIDFTSESETLCNKIEALCINTDR